MKNITKATVKRINKMYESEDLDIHFIGKDLRDILIAMMTKNLESWDTVTNIPNTDQLSLYITPTMRGLGINYFGLFTTTECLDLSYITIKDFNGLVKTVYETQFCINR